MGDTPPSRPVAAPALIGAASPRVIYGALAAWFALTSALGGRELLQLLTQTQSVKLALGLLVTALVIAAGAFAIVSRHAPVRTRLAFLIALGLAARLAVYFWLFRGNQPLLGDSPIYIDMAERLVSTGVLQYQNATMGTVQALYPPGYILLLSALFWLFGTGEGAIVGVNLVIYAATAVALYHVGRALLGERASLLGVLLFSLWPSQVFDAGVAQKEALVNLLVVLIVVALQKLHSSRGSAPLMQVGALALPWGALALTQPALAPFPAILTLGLLRQWPLKRFVGFALKTGLVLMVIMLPWWVRNYQIFDRFVPLTTSSGWTLWVGNNPNATGDWMAPPPELRNLPEATMSEKAGERAVQWISANPERFAALTATKFLRVHMSDYFPVKKLNTTANPKSEDDRANLKLFLQAPYVLVLVLSLFLCLRLARRGGASVTAVPALILAACLLQMFAFNVWFEFSERHRYFMVPWLCLVVAQLWVAASNSRRATAQLNTAAV